MSRWLRMAAALMLMATTVPVHAEDAGGTRARMGAEALARARTAAREDRWTAVASDAVMAATMAPSRLSKTLAGVALARQQQWQQAAVWLRDAGADSNKADAKEVEWWLAALRGLGPSLLAARASCPPTVPLADLLTIAAYVDEAAKVKATLAPATVCLRVRFPALGEDVQVRQNGQPLRPQADGTWLALPGAVELVVSGQAPIRVPVAGTDGATVTPPLPRDPLLDARITLQGLSTGAELVLDGAPIAVPANHVLMLAPEVEHVLEVSAPGREPLQQRINAGVRTEANIQVALRRVPPSWHGWLAMAGGGLAAVGGAGFWVFGVRPVNTLNQLSLLDPTTGREAGFGYQQHVDTIQAANRAQWVTGSLVVAGVAAAVVGAIARVSFDLTAQDSDSP